ncbi:hypothetical protein [Rhizobium rhizogenes]|uniref:hypothetical protein n=1 Tax=Rhizobium rhizogenes TaxID=359 RepID=UPI001572A047|nr:hypothetical protein [Rhizobium rhizogenes]NTF79508.1 hypothetical protein [Rhizobium rhizogenes]NTI72463.1 hypothetical protein [Rhizobium rhizogenes]
MALDLPKSRECASFDLLETGNGMPDPVTASNASCGYAKQAGKNNRRSRWAIHEAGGAQGESIHET